MNLALLQLGDSALPIGGYTHSWGLEAAIAHGQVFDAATLEGWTRDWLQAAFGPLEGVIVAVVCRSLARGEVELFAALSPRSPRGRGVAGEGRNFPNQAPSPPGPSPPRGEGSKIEEQKCVSFRPPTQPPKRNAGLETSPELLPRTNAILDASLPNPSLRNSSREMGEQLLALASTWLWSAEGVARIVTQASQTGWHHAVVFGLLGALAGAGPVDTLTVYLHQAALGMIGAGVRALPVGHTQGQQILAYLHAGIEDLALTLAQRDLESAGSGCPYYEILCDEQTRLYTRLFRS